MKNKMKNVCRILVAVIVLAMIVLGYICYEKTLVAWWIPVVGATVLAAVTMPLTDGRLRWLVGNDITLNRLCHFYMVGGTAYFLLLGANYQLASASSACEEEVTVEGKEHVERHQGYRSGRRYRRSNRVSHHYYLTVRLTDGTVKELPVSRSVYNHSRQGMKRTINLQNGLFGFRVVKEKAAE